MVAEAAVEGIGGGWCEEEARGVAAEGKEKRGGKATEGRENK